MDDVTARIADLMEPTFLKLLEGLGLGVGGNPLAIEAKMVGMALTAARRAYPTSPATSAVDWNTAPARNIPQKKVRMRKLCI